jgi:tetratricopeptide (TPR) repeat protein
MRVDGRADVYSLGLVFLEMIGAQLPESSTTDLVSTLPEVLKATVPNAATRSSIEPALNRALAVKPDDRHPTARELVDELAGSEFAAQARRSHRRLGVGSILAAIVAVTAVIFGVAMPSGSEAAGPRRVAVAVFENQTGDSSLAPLGAMAADWITEGLARTGLVEIVGLRSTLGTDVRAASGEDRVRALAAETGADLVVWGSYYAFADTLRFQTSVTDTEEERVLQVFEPVTTIVDDPLAAVEELRQRVMGFLAAQLDGRLNSFIQVSGRPPSYQAYQYYVEAMDLFVRLQQEAAIRRFYLAVAEDSTFVAPLVFAAFAHATLNQWREADSVARIADRARDTLGPTDRPWLDWVLGETRGDLGSALAAIRQVAEMGGGTDALISLAFTALAANRPAESMRAFEAINPDRGFLRGFFLLWEGQAGALHMLGDHEEELRRAREGRARFPEMRGVLEHEIRALIALGRLAEVDSLWNVFVSLPSQNVLPKWTGDVYRLAALDARAHGFPGPADTLLQRALEWYRELPDSALAEPLQQYGLARTSYVGEEYDRAQRLFEGLARQQPDSIAYHGYLGAIAARRGDRARAERIAERLSELDRPLLHGAIPFWRGRIAAVLGDRERAVAQLNQAFAEGRRFDADLDVSVDLQGLRGFPPYESWLEPKG